jgi:hypothetical protein
MSSPLTFSDQPLHSSESSCTSVVAATAHPVPSPCCFAPFTAAAAIDSEPSQAACQFALMEKEERNRKKEKLKEDEERSSSGRGEERK